MVTGSDKILAMDPEAVRKGLKARTRSRDGYKEPGGRYRTRNRAGDSRGPDRFQHLISPAAIAQYRCPTQPPCAEIVAASAYASGAALETFDDQGLTLVRRETAIVREPHIKDGFHRDDFCIDTGACSR